MKKLIGIAAACVAVAFSSGAFAVLTPAQRTEAAALVKQFGAAEFDARQKAVEKLIAMGPDVRTLVEKTLEETKDAEVKLRCEMVLKALPAKPSAAGNLNLEASRITLDFQDEQLDGALQMLAAASGNRPIAATGGGNRRGLAALFEASPTFTLSIKDKPYWEALDLVCREAGVAYDQNWSTKEPLRLRKTQNKNDDCAVYAGPAVVRLDSIARSESTSRYRRFRNDPSGGNPTQRNSSLQFSLRWFVEDRLPVMASAIELSKAQTPDGVNRLPQWYLERNAREKYGSGGQVPFCGQHTLQIDETAAPLTGPMTIEGKVLVEMAVGRIVTTKLEGIKLAAFAGEKSVETDGVELRLTKVEAQGGRATLHLDLRADEAIPIFIGDRESVFGFALVNTEGKRYAQVNQFSWRGKDGGSVGGSGNIRLNRYNNGGELDGKLQLTFDQLPTLEGDWSLVLIHPERSETKTYPFVLKDLALP